METYGSVSEAGELGHRLDDHLNQGPTVLEVSSINITCTLVLKLRRISAASILMEIHSTNTDSIPLLAYLYLWDGLELLDKKVKEMNTMLIFC